MLEIIFLFILIGYWGYFYSSNYIKEIIRKYRLLQNLPGPKGIPIFGVFFEATADPCEYNLRI